MSGSQFFISDTDNSGLTEPTPSSAKSSGMEVVDKIVAAPPRRIRQSSTGNPDDGDGQRIGMGSLVVLLLAERHLAKTPRSGKSGVSKSAPGS